MPRNIFAPLTAVISGTAYTHTPAFPSIVLKYSTVSLDIINVVCLHEQAFMNQAAPTEASIVRCRTFKVSP